MSGTPAMVARCPDAQAIDPYRVLFDQLSAGAARCRLIVERNQVVAVELVDSNRAFAAVRGALPRLLGALARVRETGRPATLQLRGDREILAVSAYPIGDGAVDEVMVVIENITAREQLEQCARESQRRFEQVFHGNAVAMVIAQRSDLRIVDVNARWLAMFDATRDEVIGRTSVELGLISEDRAHTRIAQHQVFADGYDVELELNKRSGGKLTVLARARPIEIAEGTCTLTTLIDITRRKHAEEAFAIAFSASPAGMILVDDQTHLVVAVNRRLLEMTGGRREDLVGRRADEIDLVVSPSRETLLAEIERRGRLDGVEIELARTPGPGVWTLASTEMVTLHHKVHRLSVFIDITARKQLERRLVTQNVVGRRLAESSSLDAAIPDVLEVLCRGEGWHSGAVWLPGADDATLRCCGSWCSPACGDGAASLKHDTATLPGGLPGRVLATGVAEKIVIDPTTCARAAAVVAAGMRHAVAFPVLRGSAVLGVIAMVGCAAGDALDPAERVLFDAVGHLLGLFIERIRAEASLRELNSELERRVSERTHALETSNRDLEAFGSSVSHDLRAPLRAILGFSEILLEDLSAELPDEAKELIGRIHASGGRLHLLVEDLLTFARLGSDGLNRIRIELDPLVRSVCDELLAVRALGDRLELRVMPLGVCHADRSLLRTVWTNLIDNALKYAQRRDHIVIEIGREVRGSEVIYHVRDNGVGFDPAHADRLFGVFQRLHSASEFEGTGIGLANVRRIVERHRGRVAASSVLGRGSQFEFTLGAEVT